MKLQRFFALILALVFVFAAFAPVRAQDDAAPTSFFITEDGAFSVELPEGWYAAGDLSGLQVSNNEALLSAESFEVTESGSLAFLVLPLSDVDLEGFGLTVESPILEIGTAFAPLFADETTNVGEPEEVADGVARISVADATNDGVVYVADDLAPGYIGVAIMAALKGEMTEEAELEILTILSDVNFSLPLDEPFISGDDGLSFSYPTDWVINDIGGGVALVFDSQTTLDNAGAEADIVEGETRIGIIGIQPANVPAELTEETLQAFAVQATTELASSSENNPVVGEPELLENEVFPGGFVVYVPVSSDIAEGGVFLVNNEGVLHVILFSGALDEGDRAFGTALNIATSVVYTPLE
ncbi:MAG: hypothetical protein F9K46_03850 [Anaerolineae bacterium]|nr:MAG: hypothetical protein F9K46_03850 [Anaerolineae bacterium]